MKSDPKSKSERKSSAQAKVKDLPAKKSPKGGDVVWRPNHNETLVSILAR